MVETGAYQQLPEKKRDDAIQKKEAPYHPMGWLVKCSP